MKYYLLLPAALLCFVAGCSDNSQTTSEGQTLADRQALADARAEADRLRGEVDDLAARLRGEAEPVNLARTTLAKVTASSVQGARALDDDYYGVRNAFDDGANHVDGVAYSDWVSSGENDPWVELRFDANVSVVGLTAAGAQVDRVVLHRPNDGSQTHDVAAGQWSLAAPMHGVRRVRVHFRCSGPVTVHELTVLGYVPPGVEHAVADPRIAWDAASARVAAMEAYRQWGHGPAGQAVARVDAAGGPLRVTVAYKGTDMCRVNFDRDSGGKEFVPLAIMQPVATVVTDD